MKIDILYEDDDVVVVGKPAGLVVHADGRTTEPTLVDWIVKKFPEIKGVGEPLTLADGSVVDRSGIVHRIDRETSGTIIVAKNQRAFAHLKEQFQNRTVRKVYRTFVWGDIKEAEGTIDRPIGKSRSDFRQWSAERGAKGELREAKTYYNVLRRGVVPGATLGAASGNVPSKTGGEKITYIEAQPKTGRTHQIRVHMKAIQHPVVGDMLYGSNHSYALGFKRTALHSYSIEFKNLDGAVVSVTAPLPADFIEAERLLRN